MPRSTLFFAITLSLAACALFAAEPARVTTDVEFLGPGRTEKLDLYLPAGAATSSARRPALVWIHGGGWTGGTKSEARAKEICTILSEAGYVAVSIDYKLGDGAWPQNLLDCKNAVRWLRVHADRYHIDPKRVAVAGGSAGGHLALMVALTKGQSALEPSAPYPDVTSEVRCAINMYGITNLLTRQKTDAKGKPTGERELGASLRVYGARDENDPILRLASPVTHVRRSSSPILIFHGKADTTVDYLQAEELAATLKKSGAQYEMLLLDDVGHTFAFRTWGKKKLPHDLSVDVLRFLSHHNR